MPKISRSTKLSVSEINAVDKAGSKLSDSGSLSFDGAMETLLSDCIKGGYADVTMTHYKNELRVFSYYLRDCRKEALDNLYLLSPMDVHNYVQYLRNVRSAKTGGINTKLKALKRFLRANGLTNLASYCSPLPDEKYKVKAFTLDEVTRLLASCDLETFIGFRDYVMMLVFADTGIRVSELSRLVYGDFNPQEGTLFIRESKNYYSRYTPINDEVAKLVRTLTSLNASDGYIFQSIHGRQLSRVALQRRVNIAGKRANIGKDTRCSPHTFRHYYAKTMVENGANVFELQKLLGHRSLEMVRVYVNLYDKNVREAHKKYSPTNNYINR